MQHRTSTLALLPLLGLLCAATQTEAQAPSPQLTQVLAQMDTASKSFRSATADFEWDFVEKVAGISDTSKQKGSMYIERAGSGTDFGATVFEVGDNGAAAPSPSKIIAYGDGALQVYTPAEKQEDLFKAGAGKTSLEGYLSIGFGGSGHDLAQGWEITDGGPQTLTEDSHPVKTEKLVLVSKDANVRNNFKQVTIWIDPTRDLSLKQVFDTPSGDQRTAYYSNIRLNGKVNKDPFKIPSKGVTVVPH